MRRWNCLFALILALTNGPNLADIGPAPPVELIDSESRPFSLVSLQGKTVLVSFVFTTCNGTCPLTASALDRVRRKLREEGLWGHSVEFVSITLDPIHDTPDALARYARIYRADPKSWHFLTGDAEDVKKVIAAWDMWAKVNASGAIDHPSRIFLLDRRGHRREIYNLETLSPETVVSDIRGLLAERSKPR